MTSSTGALLARYDYDPYGRRTRVDNGTFTADFGYTGHNLHAQTGLGFTIYRVIDNALGRWLSRDPIEEMGGLNLYRYVANNPVRFIDPKGLDIWVGGPLGGIVHQNINIGTPGESPLSCTFGLESFTWRYGFTGTIYDDFRSSSPFDSRLYLITTPEEDAVARSILDPK